MSFFNQGMFQIDPNITPGQADNRRKAIMDMIGGMGKAKYVGAGFADLAKGIVAGKQLRDLDARESAFADVSASDTQGDLQASPTGVPSEIERLRDRLGQTQYGSAQYIGEGLAHLGQGIAEGVGHRQLGEPENTGRQNAKSLFGSLLRGEKPPLPSTSKGPMTILGVPPIENKKIPAYARGTNNHPGGLALVGEQGPEVVDLPKGSKVLPNPMTIWQQEFNDLSQEEQDAVRKRMKEGMSPEEATQPPDYNPFEMIGPEGNLRSPRSNSFLGGSEYRTADMSGVKPSGTGEKNTLHGNARAFQGFMKSLADYENTFKNGGATMWPGKRHDELGIAHRDLQMQMKELYNLGVLNGPDLDLMNQILIDPTSITGNMMDVLGGDRDMEKRIPANIEQVRNLMMNRSTPALQQLGIDPQSLMPTDGPDIKGMSDEDLLNALQGVS